MTTSKKSTAREELERIEDALVESLMGTSGEELRKEFAAAGIDPDSCIAEVEAMIAAAKTECARERLEDARAELAAWRKQHTKANSGAIDAARAKLDQLRVGDQDLKMKMMLAARKGDGLSDSDIEEILEDLAVLEELERCKDNE